MSANCKRHLHFTLFSAVFVWKVCGYTIWDVVEMYREDKLHSESLKSVFKKFRVPKVPGDEETLVQYMEMSLHLCI